MNDLSRFNRAKIIELSGKIFNCDGNFRLFALDVDGVVYSVEKYVQKFLAKVDFRATKKYRELIAREDSADSQDETAKSYAILDAILEEKAYIERLETGEERIVNYEKLDFEELYSEKYLVPLAVDFINYMLKNRQENDFFIFVSHRNPEREADVKIQKLYELFPDIDAILTPPYHMEGTKEMTNKALYIQQAFLLPNLDNVILIDDLKRNCKDLREAGGTDIRMMPNGFDEMKTLADHMSKITNLDPYNIQFALSYISYAKKHPEYVQKVDKTLKKRY